jgi:hypothetical protein
LGAQGRTKEEAQALKNQAKLKVMPLVLGGTMTTNCGGHGYGFEVANMYDMLDTQSKSTHINGIPQPGQM